MTQIPTYIPTYIYPSCVWPSWMRVQGGGPGGGAALTISSYWPSGVKVQLFSQVLKRKTSNRFRVSEQASGISSYTHLQTHAHTYTCTFRDWQVSEVFGYYRNDDLSMRLLRLCFSRVASLVPGLRSCLARSCCCCCSCSRVRVWAAPSPSPLCLTLPIPLMRCLTHHGRRKVHAVDLSGMLCLSFSYCLVSMIFTFDSNI